jgi:hypothetical protein
MSHEQAIRQAARTLSVNEFKRIFNLKTDEDFLKHSKFFEEWFLATHEGYISDMEVALKSYMDTRNAIICDAKPIAWSNAEEAFLEDRMGTLNASRWQATEKDDMPLYAALSIPIPQRA